MSPTSIVTLILAIVLVSAGGVIGYELGKGIGYVKGKAAGAAEVAASLNDQGNTLARDAEAARQLALAPGAFLRLRQGWCSDCPEAQQ
jgi:hypothetical protein